MNLTDPKFSLDFSDGGGGDLQVLPNILSPDSWLDAVVMVGVKSVKAQLAQGFNTHACQQDWPRDPAQSIHAGSFRILLMWTCSWNANALGVKWGVTFLVFFNYLLTDL